MEWAGADIFPVKDALEMVLVFDDTGNILYGNDAAVKELGYEEDLCGVSIRDVFPNDIKSSSESIEEDVSFGCELQNLVAYRKNRTCFPVEAKMIQSDTNPGKYICMANDMLEREQLSREVTKGREDARQALKVKSEFVANVTHELRTPVNGVLGNIRELLDIETDKQKLRPMHMIEQCCEDMHKIINNILDFSKLEAGKFSLEQRKFNFRDMLDYRKRSGVFYDRIAAGAGIRYRRRAADKTGVKQFIIQRTEIHSSRESYVGSIKDGTGERQGRVVFPRD